MAGDGQFLTKDGKGFVVREARVCDAGQLLAGAKAAMAEGLDYLITQPEEFTIGVDEERKWIQSFIDAENSHLFVAEHKADIIGWASLQGDTRLRTRHTALLGITVTRLWRARGVGTALMETALDWATENRFIDKVKLEAIATNKPALHLYRKLGFLEEGRLLHEFKKADGTYLDGVLMYRFVAQGSRRARLGRWPGAHPCQPLRHL